MAITNERPGVYSSYEVSSSISGSGSGHAVGICAASASGDKSAVSTVTSYSQAVSLFGTNDELCERAAEMGSERMVLVNAVSDTVGATSAAVAAAIAASTDPALPLSGAVLYGLDGGSFTDGDINTLVRGGVTPLENVSGEISIVRAVTTRTTTGGVADSTWRELSTILIVDDVIPTVKSALRSKFARSKNTAQTRGAIRTQVIIELESKLSREIIDSYGAVTVAASDEDPTVCEVTFEFAVAHGLNRIELTAHITV